MKELFFSKKIQLIMYILIIFFAPFIMCRYYLQTTIGLVSDSSFSISNFEIKIIPLIASSLLFIGVFLIRRSITKMRFITSIFVLALIYLSQKLTDIYLDNPFYDIQNNWHYFAYTIFAFLMYRYLKSINKSDQFIITTVFIAAGFISTFDETFQIFTTNRVFDISDISKDIMGVVIGLILVYYIIENGKFYQKQIRQKSISDYFKNPQALLSLELLLSFCFLFVSAILAERMYNFTAIIISIVLSIFIFLLFHFSKFKLVKFLYILIIVAQLISFGVNYKKNITHSSKYFTIYKGIIIPYFDILFYENGFFRFVDKKEDFTRIDWETIHRSTSNILIMASGETGKGANGLPKKEKMQFVTNSQKNSCIQLLILSNNEAVYVFNEMRKQNKKVTMVLHHEN